MMSHWINAVNGNFNSGKNWSGHHVPGSMDDAILDAVGGAYTVTLNYNANIGEGAVKSLQLASNATFFIKGNPQKAHAFYIDITTGGPIAAINAGLIKVGDNVTFEIAAPPGIQQTINNTGTISLSAVTGNTFLALEARNAPGGASAVLTGQGDIIMSDSSLNGIVARYTSTTLTNFDNTISGAGFIGSGGLTTAGVLTVINQAAGVIDATGAANVLMLTTPGVAVVNQGLIEATGKAGLNIAATTVNNQAGTIFAGNGSIVRLESATVQGGTLSTAGTGVVLVSGGSTIDGSAAPGAVTNTGVLQDFGEMMYAQGAITNAGSIRLSDETTGAVMQVGAAGLTLSGAGTVTLTDNFQNGIQGDGSGSVLVNTDNVISGAGTVGGNQLGLTNASKGVIDATGTYNALRLYGPGLTFANSGLIEATSKGGLDVAAVTLNQSGGGSLTVASGSVVNLESANLVGGTFTNAAGGQVVASGGSSETGTMIVNQGTFSVVQADTFSASGSIINSGTISLIGTGFGGAHMLATGNLTLSGGGLVALGDGGSIDSAAAGAVITNVDNLIGGSGELGAGAGKLVNMAGGVIFASGIDSEILIEAAKLVNAGDVDAGQSEISVLSAVTNSGTMHSETNGLLSLTGAVNNTGVLEANGGMLIAYRDVTGGGSAVITGAGLGGRLEFMRGFSENVTFTGSTGSLYLARSQSYAGAITGFSATGGTSLDLRDIKFVSAGEATFSGTAAGGTLTVTDGTHTAHIALIGDYLGSTFQTARNSGGGVVVTAGAAAAMTPPAMTVSANAFVAAMAGFGGGAAAAVHSPHDSAAATPALVALPKPAMQ